MNKLPTVNLFHVLFVAPLLFYVGYMNNYGVSKPNKIIYDLLMFLAVMVFAYHGWRAYSRM